MVVVAGILGCHALIQPPPPDGEAQTFFVAPDGDDRGTGLAGEPWASLARAAKQVGPGDTVIVRPGRYDGFVLYTSGTAEAPIRFLAEPGVLIEDPAPRDGINLEGAAHVELRGFTVRGARRAGIRAVDCQGVVIRNNRLDRNGKWGVFTGFCEGVLIEGNEASRSVEQHGIYVSNSADEPVVRRNHSWGNRLAGIQLNGDVNTGKGVDGIISGAVIEANVVHGNGRRGAAAINLDGVQGAVIVNNLLYDNQASGIALFRIDGGGPSTGNLVAHNTVIMPAGKSRWALLLRNGARDNTVINNIFLSLNQKKGAIDASTDSLRGLASDHNLLSDRFTTDDAATIVPLAEWRQLTGGDQHSSIANDIAGLFTNVEATDFRPTPSSPARAGGLPLSEVGLAPALRVPATDHAGLERPRGRAPAIGAFELP